MINVRQKFYKFRDFHKRDRLKEIFDDQRLYCARRDQLNDPFEGWFCAGVSVGKYNYRVTVNGCDSKRVCSLSACFSSVQQWAHYADGHKGIAIEFEPDEPLKKVCYDRMLFDPQATAGAPPEPLLHKGRDWKYENEYRYISTKKWLHGNVVGVIFGAKTPGEDRQFIEDYCQSLGAYTADAYLDATSYEVKIAKPTPGAQ